MNKAKILEKLIKESGYSVRSFALKCGIPESTLYTILKKGVGRASVDNIILICQTLGITVEELDKMAKGSEPAPEPSYEDVERLIARRGKYLNQEQKLRLIQLLTGIEE